MLSNAGLKGARVNEKQFLTIVERQSMSAISEITFKKYVNTNKIQLKIPDSSKAMGMAKGKQTLKVGTKLILLQDVYFVPSPNSA